MLSVAMSLSTIVEPASTASSARKGAAETTFADSLQRENGLTLPIVPLPEAKGTNQKEKNTESALPQAAAPHEPSQEVVSIPEKDVKPTTLFIRSQAVAPSTAATKPAVSEPTVLPASTPRAPVQTVNKAQSARVPTSVSADANPVLNPSKVEGSPLENKAAGDSSGAVVRTSSRPLTQTQQKTPLETSSPSQTGDLSRAADSLPGTTLPEPTQVSGTIAEVHAAPSTVLQSPTVLTSQQPSVAQASASVLQAPGDAQGVKTQAAGAKKSVTVEKSAPGWKHEKAEATLISAGIDTVSQAIPTSADASLVSLPQGAPVTTAATGKETFSAITQVSRNVTVDRSAVARGNGQKETASLPAPDSNAKSDPTRDIGAPTSSTIGTPFAAALQGIQGRQESSLTPAAATPVTSPHGKPVPSPHPTASATAPFSIANGSSVPSVSGDSTVAVSSSQAQQAIPLPPTRSGSTEVPAAQPQIAHPSMVAEAPGTRAHSTRAPESGLPVAGPNGMMASHQAEQETATVPGPFANLGAVVSGDSNTVQSHGFPTVMELIQSPVPIALGVATSGPARGGSVSAANGPSDGLPSLLPHTDTGSQVIGYQNMEHHTLQATPTMLEVGVPGGAHGWLKIRAELDESGTVRASLAPSTKDGEEQLQRDLPGMSAFLEGEHLPVSLHVAHTAAPSPVFDLSDAGTGSLGRGAGDAGSSLADTSSQQQARQEQPAVGSGDLSPNSNRASTTDRPSADREEAAWSPEAGYTGAKAARGGAWLNVMA